MPLRSSNTTDWYIAMCFLSVPSSLIFVCGHLAFLWPILNCEKDWALYNCCTYIYIIIYYIYIYLYVCVNVTRLYKRCITDPMDVVTYSGNLLGWRGANAIGNGKGSVEMSAGAPQGLGMLGKLYYRSRVSEIKVIPEYRHAHLLIIRHIPCMYALIPVLTWKFPFIYIYIHIVVRRDILTYCACACVVSYNAG